MIGLCHYNLLNPMVNNFVSFFLVHMVFVGLIHGQYIILDYTPKLISFFVCHLSSKRIVKGLQMASLPDVIDAFTSLLEIFQQLQSTSCQHLYCYIKQTISYWYKVLRKILQRYDVKLICFILVLTSKIRLHL